jgi:hypothetical protein
MVAVALGLSACGNSGSVDELQVAIATAPEATPKAVCGPGSNPETGIQGRGSQADHDSGRAALGYTCNTELVGSYTIPNAIGTVAGFKVERYVDAAGHDCAYYDTTLVYPLNLFDGEAGVNVLDMADSAHPMLTARLTTPAMLSPHESVVVSKERGILAAVMGNPAAAPGVVDVYDISQDCRHPVLKAVTPIGVLGHESGMAPDGKTFYSASPGSPSLVAIDISNPSVPVPLALLPFYSHGLSVSDDGNRIYIASIGIAGTVRAYSNSAIPNFPDPNHERGLVIVDVSEIQARKPLPQVREISRLQWHPGSIPQNAIPITIKGHPYLVEIDEYGQQYEVGAGRIIDIADEAHPQVISNLRLEVHNPQNFADEAADPGAKFVGQGYAGHYCNVPTRTDPTIVACSMILSGLRVFDIRDPYHPREVAYFNAPINPRVLPVPTPASNYAMSSPSFVPERHEIWYSDTYSGFYVVRLTNNAWPE